MVSQMVVIVMALLSLVSLDTDSKIPELVPRQHFMKSI